ncbi:alpha/beta hydrolase [Vreelandella olivaria]|uniref:Alpha/beta hydrolase n=1 Tax=Vreelandella olivaria TaxID=390919 RepID=A0ABM7GMD5_9GAMM|nr:alpha/beta hydrolase [Halomonas olivaria]
MERVYDRLTAEGLKVTVTQLPMTSVEDDVTAFSEAWTQDGPVLLVGHSYGGVVVTEAGIDPDVKGLVYVTAFQPDIGESGGDLLASAASDFTADKLTVSDDGFLLVNDDAFSPWQVTVFQKKMHSFGKIPSMGQRGNLAHKVTSAAWQDKPSWMTVATEDLLISPELQRRMAERAGSIVIEIKNGHMLPMTSPDEVAEVIAQAAKAVN